jgi:hypothetical protein
MFPQLVSLYVSLFLHACLGCEFLHVSLMLFLYEFLQVFIAIALGMHERKVVLVLLNDPVG